MKNKLNKNEAMHIVGVIPVAQLNHLPIDFKVYKKSNDGCLEFKTKIKFRDGSMMMAVYHQWERVFKKTKNPDDLIWEPSWYEFYYGNKGKRK